MKRLLLFCGMMAASATPTLASSITEIDAMVTGPKGPSIIVLGPEEDESAVSPMITSSFASLAAPGRQPINMKFARKFPDPAVPVPAPADPSDDAPARASAPLPNPVQGTGNNPADEALAPMAPPDAGTIPAQPPVSQSDLRPTKQGEALAEPGVPDGMQQVNVAPPAKIITGG
ncbi:MAG: hypothetical protein MUC58_04995 [Rhizobiaceae bacterium]|jgi:hypothetical protein|nr:hypothetical protein [Rhizobiaceae bacterium]